MESKPYSQRFKTNFIYGIKIGIAPIFLINILLVLTLSIGFASAMWDVELFDGVLISLIFITPFIIVTILGIAFISAIISSNKKFSSTPAYILGALTGIALMTIGNAIIIYFGVMSFEFTALPSFVSVALLTYIGSKMNGQTNSETETIFTKPDLRSVFHRTFLWIILLAFAGIVVYVLTYEGFLDSLSIFIYLGYALLISFPIGVLVWWVIRVLAKKNQTPAFLNWPIWERINHLILETIKGFRKRIGNHPIPKMIGVVVLAYGIFFALSYLLITLPSNRELWRITDYRISEPMVINDLFIFHGYKEDRSIDCYCLYAVNKSTGEFVWSTEELAKPYMEEVQRLGLGSSDFFSVGTGIEYVSQTSDILYISLSYWTTEYHDSKYVLFAVKNTNGEILWEVDGMIDYESISDSITRMNRIFIVDAQGDLLAIDSNTGEEVWRRNVYQYYDDDYTWFHLHNDIVVISIHSSEYIMDDSSRGSPYCCDTNEKHYEQFAAYSAETGQLLWESIRLDSGWNYTFNKTLYVEAEPWEISPYIDEGDNTLVTAIDLETGKKRWELKYPDAHSFSLEAGPTGEALFIIKTFEGGFEDFHKLAKLIVVDEFTGKLIWHFNRDLAYGDFDYLIKGNDLYIGTEDGSVYSVNIPTGNIIWQTEIGDFPYPYVIQGNTLIAIHEEKYISAFDIKTGLKKWKLNLGIDDSWSVFWDEILENNNQTIFVVGNNNQRLYAIDIDTGNKLWSWNHFRPTNSEYELGLFDNNILYVDQRPKRNVFSLFMPYSFARDDWYFAIKTDSQ